jgi:hypothetical protein
MGSHTLKQIIVINSFADQRFLSFFEKVFYAVGVGTVWEDYGSIAGKIAAGSFQKTVAASSALFLILSRDAQVSVRDGDLYFLKLDFMKDKDIFVFEHCEDLKRISLRVPKISHYFSMYITNAWTDEVVKCASAFEAANPLPLSLPDAVLEPLSPLAEETFFDKNSGMALFDLSTSRPAGKKAVCPHCASAYRITTPVDMKVLRCPLCGQFSGIKVEEKAGAQPAPTA